MSVSPVSPAEKPERRYSPRGTVPGQIILPAGLALLVIMGLTVLIVTTRTPTGISIFADLFLAFLCLLPLILCMTPVYLGMIFGAVYVGRLNHTIVDTARRARQATERLEAQTEAVTDNINRTTINASARIAPLERLFSVFDRPGENDEHKPNP